MTSGAKERSGVMISTLPPVCGDELGRLQAGMVAGVVEEQHVRARLDVAGDDVPGRHDQLVAGAQHLGMRQAAGGDDDDVGVFGEHVVGLGPGVEAERRRRGAAHCATRQSMMPIISRRRLLCAVSRIWPPAWLAASNTTTSWPRSAATRAASRPAGPAPTTTILRLRRRLGDVVRHGRSRGRSPRCGCNRPRRPGRCGRGSSWRRRRGGCRASRPSMILRTICGSVMWARVMPTMSSLPEAMAWRAVATSWILAAWKVGKFGGGADLAGEVEMRRARHALDRDDVGQAGVGVDMAADDVEEIDHAAVLEAPARSRGRPSLVDAAVQHLVGGVADADDEVRRRPARGWRSSTSKVKRRRLSSEPP